MDIQKIFPKDLTAYRAIPFWSWNDKLDPEVLRRQIREMKAAGIGGFFMHARGGLETEYLGEDWFTAVDACIDEARKQGMDAWCYDENGWPSGFAGMKLLKDPENLAHFLECREVPSYDPEALVCCRREGRNLVRVTGDDGQPCTALYDRTNSSVVDILNPEIVRKFIDETHEKYADRFLPSFGEAMKGFFTDEPQYFRWATAYSPVMLSLYRETYGEDLLDVLGALFIDCAQSDRLRLRYWRLMNRQFAESFGKQIYDWCTEHGCMLTGHAVEESSLFGQMFGCAGVMPFYEYESTPGVDWLGRDISSEMMPRQVSSAAQQLGKKHVLTETFACAGWNITPRRLKRIAEWQYVHGVNQMCQHLYPYSIRGQRKRDYPAFYSPHNPWTKEFKAFNDYFTHLGVLLAESTEEADVAVIHPMHSAYLTFKRDDESSIDELNSRFIALIERLGASGIGHHYADESLLAKYGSVEGDTLVIGKCRYHKVVVPQMDNLDLTTVQLLRTFVEKGGKLWLEGECPRLCDGELENIGFESNITYEMLASEKITQDTSETEIRSTLRHSEQGDFLYAVNLSENETQSVVYTVRGEGAVRFDPLTRETSAFPFKKSGDRVILNVTLEAGESAVLLLTATPETPAAVRPETRELPLDGLRLSAHTPNALTLDRAALSEDGGKTFTEEMNVIALTDRLLRRRKNAPVVLRYTFETEDAGLELSLEAETARLTACRCNGKPVSLTAGGTIEPLFGRASLKGMIRTGVNTLELEVDYRQSEEVYAVFNGVYYDHTDATESLLNCLSYETDIEAVYLLGDFHVRAPGLHRAEKDTLQCGGGFVLSKEKETYAKELTENGFPFFGGTAEFTLPFEARGDETVLRVEGPFAIGYAEINGKPAGRLMFGQELDISGLVGKGGNTLTLSLTGSLRNLLGPFHGIDPEPVAVSPDFFSCFGTWKDGKSPRFAERYALVPFGLESVRIG